MIEELIALLLADPAVRGVIEEVAVKLFAQIFFRREIDPKFKAASDACFAQLAQAQTDEETKNAHLALQALMANP